MAVRAYHLKDIPVGLQIYSERLEVAGVSHRRAAAVRFAKAKGQWLELEPEPTNRYDRNAIRVIGCWKRLLSTAREFVGYVPKGVAAVIARGGFLNDVQPRLLKTYLGDEGYVEVLFQLVGPKARAHEFKQSFVQDCDHYSGFVDKVKYLKQQGRLDDAVDLLLRLVDETEAEAKRHGKGWGVAPWYYEQLAIVYRKQKRFEHEVAILERYAAQPKAPGVGPTNLEERLRKARASVAR